MTRAIGRNFHTSTSLGDRRISSTLSDSLREQYQRRSFRVIKGDNVRVLRGEYSGIEGKVEKINTTRGSLSIEGIQREKVKGGNVKVLIHASNVIITGLNFDDSRRKKSMEKTKDSSNLQKAKESSTKTKAKRKGSKA